MKAHYRTAVVETACEPLEIAVGLAESALFDTYVIYETPGGWSIANGVAAEVTVDAQVIRSSVFGSCREEPWSGDPLAAVRKFLDDLPVTDWAAYGWCAFELSHAIAGMEVDGQRLLHLVVPETEVRLSGSRATLRSLNASSLADVEDVLARIASDAATGATEARLDQLTSVPVRLDLGAEEYRRSVASLVEEIRVGKLQKAILSREIPLEDEIDFPAGYRQGRRENTPARSFLFDMGGLRCFGFSPETVLEVFEDGRVASQPLAGTRALTGDPDLDRKLREDLLSDPKELHEHAISVKLAVDELAELCEPESVFVEEFMSVKERGSVQHLASKVVGRVPEGTSAWDAFAVVFPAITASGIPKHAAYQAIRRHERSHRGPYAGTVLKVTERGTMDAALVLRSVYAQGGRTWLRAGAGIVEQSQPARELEETQEKLRSVATSVLARPKGASTAPVGARPARAESYR
ncbi:salicylate synthase [Streptomyces sp. NPDC005438]|uniref:salicylate synthase n=1 Tax=Streptomyces sp. NPDC005438 TaxID=3156880 RepID=UPI0033AB6952